MASILYKFIYKAIEAVLEREPTELEFFHATEAVRKVDKKAFDIDWWRGNEK